MSSPERSGWDPNELSEVDKLRMFEGETGELPVLTPTERSDMEIELETFETGKTPQQVLAERILKATRTENRE